LRFFSPGSFVRFFFPVLFFKFLRCESNKSKSREMSCPAVS
jgi:hypothetical protein